MADDPIIVIGGGSAGSQAARALARAGRRVVIADPGPFGGTCLWRGCVPKKSLYHAAGVRREMLAAARMGFGDPGAAGPAADGPAADGPDPAPDWPRLLAWQRGVQQAYAGDQEGILRGLGVEVVQGRARFRSPDVVEIAGEPRRASHVIVATGSHAERPPIPGAELMDTSDEALFYPVRPASLLVVGGGYIAMELAGIYASLGTAVTLVVRGRRVLRPFDPECGEVALDGLRALGVTVFLETETLGVKRRDGSQEVRVAGVDGERTLVTERVLAATGRRAAVEHLDLAAGEVEVDDRGRPTLLPSLRSRSNPRVWVAGDAAAGPQLTPVASYEGRLVAQSVLDGSDRPPDLAVVPSTCFTDPQVARVGASEEELAARDEAYLVARGGFAGTAQGIIEGDAPGLIKLLAGADGRLLGAHLAGPQAAELIYGLALGVRAGLTLEAIQETSAVHPSLAEALNWASYAVERIG